ncbi:MAG TPA: hypothetical protein VFI25_19885 [Planctomycetota bacterium]|jgi:hypothetical protein|nr:hypothetical protein [Planctomycetota bacterium]
MKVPRRASCFLPALVVAALSTGAAAQPNAVAGLDIALQSLGYLGSNGHSGTFPNGTVAVGMSTTACNPGSVQIPWNAPMNANHPFIAFLVARENAGRFVQISNRSYCKHPFASTNSSGCGVTCFNPGTSSILGVGCSDTYGAGLNGSYSSLGPPDEINPWTGAWSPVCSYFDAGQPPVTGPAACDGIASGISFGTNATAFPRCLVLDSNLTLAGSTYYAYSGWIAAGEPESNRTNNFLSRGFAPTWNGSAWTFGSLTSPLTGTILSRWSGAAVTSNTNGSDDGRLFVGVKVTGPTAGFYHYEYAVHNRDNKRGVGAFRLPTCPGARIQNVGFRDIDANAGNDWAFFQAPTEISWASPAGNPLNWNALFNFWFDTDAAPATGQGLLLDEAASGPGLPTVTVTGTAPIGLWNPFLGAGCGSPAAPTLYATGTPARATLGNASFGLASGGNAAGATVFLVGGTADGSQSIAPGCTLYTAGTIPTSVFVLPPVLANGSGLASFAFAVPNDVGLEGTHLNFHAVESQVGSGAVLGVFDLSDGLEVRIGSAIASCP